MRERIPIALEDCAGEVLRRMAHGGVLCTVVDSVGRSNLLTLGWGRSARPIMAIPSASSPSRRCAIPGVFWKRLYG